MPSVLGGLKSNPWLHVNAVVTMFDSGGSSGQLRDELGVLPPGDILKCALALSRNTNGSAARAARAPADAGARAAGRSHGRQPAAFHDAELQRRLPQRGRRTALAPRVPWTRLACYGRKRAASAREYGDGSITRGEVEVDAGQTSGRLVKRCLARARRVDSSGVATAIADFDAVIIGPGSFYTSLMPNFLVRGVPEALAR